METVHLQIAQLTPHPRIVAVSTEIVQEKDGGIGMVADELQQSSRFVIRATTSRARLDFNRQICTTQSRRDGPFEQWAGKLFRNLMHDLSDSAVIGGFDFNQWIASSDK
jgi:hypothetical protein